MDTSIIINTHDAHDDDDYDDDDDDNGGGGGYCAEH